MILTSLKIFGRFGHVSFSCWSEAYFVFFHVMHRTAIIIHAKQMHLMVGKFHPFTGHEGL